MLWLFDGELSVEEDCEYLVKWSKYEDTDYWQLGSNQAFKTWFLT